MAKLSKYELTLLATALLLLIYPPQDALIGTLSRALALSMIVFPQHVLRLPAVWLAATTLAILGVVYDWHSADNHKYLLAYWLMAIFCTMHAASPARALAASARYLIVCTMSWAVYHKVASEDYLTGEFFTHAILLDERFDSIAKAFVGLSQSVLEDNRVAVEHLTHWSLKTDEVSIAGTPQLAIVAQFVTWLGILLEAAIAVVFMFPPTYRMLGATRDWILLGFVGVVYPLATVLGFAYTLVAMGLAQSQGKRATWAYALCLPAMQLFGYHWSSAL